MLLDKTLDFSNSWQTIRVFASHRWGLWGPTFGLPYRVPAKNNCQQRKIRKYVLCLSLSGFALFCWAWKQVVALCGCFCWMNGNGKDFAWKEQPLFCYVLLNGLVSKCARSLHTGPTWKNCYKKSNHYILPNGPEWKCVCLKQLLLNRDENLV